MENYKSKIESIDDEAYSKLQKDWYLSLLPTMQITSDAFEIKYMTTDGKEFDNEFEAMQHDDIVSRQRYYDHLMANRNWLQRFFNIKPSMAFYDKIQFKVQLNRMKK